VPLTKKSLWRFLGEHPRAISVTQGKLAPRARCILSVASKSAIFS